MRVLVNAIGIIDSGGVTVLEKLLHECVKSGDCNMLIIMLTRSHQIESLVKKYQDYDMLSFKMLKFNSYIYRLYYENSTFKRFVALNGIDLVYNFTSTSQLFLACPQLIKMHNLLYYSKELDNCYKKNSRFILWLRQVFLKRIVFKFMLNKSKYIEIQSRHVQDCLSDFISIKNKHIFIKSDVDVADRSFMEPKKYDFTKKLKFLYIVGPHFDYTHKNFFDFTSGMLELSKLNINFEINITLSKDQLTGSKLWDDALNSKTNFYGYTSNPKKMKSLFCDNTILVSTSVIETLGLHVIEATRNGLVTITPNEDYAKEVYGTEGYRYDLFDINSFSQTVKNVIREKDSIKDTILIQQKYLRENEMNKFDNIVDVFREVLDVQR